MNRAEAKKRAQELVWQTEEERKKAEENLEQMERMKCRQYTPRKLTGLFDEQIRQVV